MAGPFSSEVAAISSSDLVAIGDSRDYALVIAVFQAITKEESLDGLISKVNFIMLTVSPTDRIFILAGAGLSAESGIPTFRGVGGLWRNYRIEEVASPRALFSRVAAIAIQEHCFGIMLHVLDWNEMAIQFYKKMDATFLDNWKTVCVKGSALRIVARAEDD